MARKGRIIYWAATIFLSIGMTAGGIQKLLQVGGYNATASSLGYPLYLLSILGAWKLLGVAAILVPKFPILKEWAYAVSSLQCQVPLRPTLRLDSHSEKLSHH